MQITDTSNATKKDVVVELVSDKDYKLITKEKYHFNWKNEKQNSVFKLRLYESEEILGLMSLKHFEDEMRFEIKLLEVSKVNVGKKKRYEGIAGNLIAYACREAISTHAENGCVSLTPKTKLKKHYMEKYGMLDAGIQIFLEGRAIFGLLKTYAL